MPLYDYRAKDSAESCDRCREGFEVAHGMTESGPKTCPECGCQVVRAISAPQIKGGRWSSKRLFDKDNMRKKGFRTGSDLLESGEVKL
jgi:putative FmdB family regulatory protein